MAKYEPTVFIVDDDEAVLKGLRLLIKSVKLNVETYLSAQEFMDSYDPAQPGCLVLDVRMPGMSGLELQETLLKKKISIPIILLSGHGDVSMAVQAMRKGAVDFLEKPFNAQVFLDRVHNAIATDTKARKKQAERDKVLARLSQLSEREHKVAAFITAGKTNKEIAFEFDISRRAAAFHRTHILEKMQVKTNTELAQVLTKFDLV